LPSSGSRKCKSGELQTFVVYDIPNDRLRTQVSEACLDYGLERIQYSAFVGNLSINRRAELFMRLQKLIGDKPGKVMVIAVCEKDANGIRQIVNEEAPMDGARSRGTWA